MVASIAASPPVNTVIALSTLGRVTLTAQGANSSLFVPGVIVSLNTSRPSPVTYNAAGVLSALLQVAPANSPSGGDNGAVINLAALLGFDATAAGAGFLNPAVSLEGLPATTVRALEALSASIPGNGGAAVSVEQTLARLLAINLNATASLQDNADVVANVTTLNDLLQGLPAERRAEALDNLLSSGLGLAAANPDRTSVPGSALLFPGLPGDGTVQSALDLVASSTTQPTVPLGAATAAEAVAAAEFAATAPASALSILTTTTEKAAAELGAPTLPAPTPRAAAAPAAGPAEVPVAAAATPTTAAAVGGSTTDQAFRLLLDATRQAEATISGNPAYASVAAALYMGALRHRMQLAVTPAADAGTFRPVGAAHAIAAVARRAG